MKIVVILGGFFAAAAIYAGLAGIAKDISPGPPPKVLEFRGTPIVTDVSDAKATIVYQMRRNESCTTLIQVRWYDIEKNGYDADYRPDPFKTVPAPVTAEFQPFSIRVKTPNAPGRWAYDPIITPGADCDSSEQIQPPFAIVNIE